MPLSCSQLGSADKEPRTLRQGLGQVEPRACRAGESLPGGNILSRYTVGYIAICEGRALSETGARGRTTWRVGAEEAGWADGPLPGLSRGE